MPKKLKANSDNPIVIYQDSKNTPAISLLLEDDTLWFTQRQISELGLENLKYKK